MIPHGTRKLVTALSGKLGNALVLAEELGTEAMHNLMERFFLLSLSKIEESDGRLSHLLDAGFLALFGLSQPDTDSALLAVRVAVELHNHWNEDLKTRHLTDPAAQLRMGLHTGMVIKREIGAKQHRVYMPVGDTIYLANALQHYAEPGTILSSEATYRRVQDVVYGSVAGLMPIEGKTTSAVTYSIFGLNEIALHPPHILSSLS